MSRNKGNNENKKTEAKSERLEEQKGLRGCTIQRDRIEHVEVNIQIGRGSSQVTGNKDKQARSYSV